jgi:drug/metabolite transporter (DMT)-like permease
MAVGVLGVSTSGPLIASMTVPALAIAFWRNAFATIALAPYAMTRALGELRAIPRRTWWLMLGAGVLLALHFAAWVPSLSYTSVASSTALVCMQVAWTAIFARLAGHVITRRAWTGMAIAFLGVLVVTGVDLSVSTEALFGDLLALLGGVFSGAYVIVGGVVRRDVSTTAYTFVCYGACAGLLLVTCLVAGQQLGGYDRDDWTKLLTLTVAAQLLGHTVFNRVLRTTSPVVVSLVILLEVPGASILAAIWLGQVPPPAAVPAIALILVGIAVVISSRPPEPALPPE